MLGANETALEHDFPVAWTFASMILAGGPRLDHADACRSSIGRWAMTRLMSATAILAFALVRHLCPSLTQGSPVVNSTPASSKTLRR